MKQPWLTITISPQALEMMQRLVPYGLYGRNVAQVAQRFLYEAIRKHLVERGEVRKR